LKIYFVCRDGCFVRIVYKVTSFYDKDSEIGVMWNDPDLNIDWKIKPEEAILSEKDKQLQNFKDLKAFF
jgi:dTDP-4-dehydrorhamnose 3,5-epimerase